MLKLGNQEIAAIYLGGQKITKAYLGTTVVFDTARPPEPATYTITLSVDPQGGGTVAGGGSVEEGMSVTVSSTPASGYTFSGWRENGAIVSTSPSYTFTATSDRSLTAVFVAEVQNYNIVTSVDPAGSGAATGAGTYQQGASVTVTAVPGAGYNFVKWTENGQTVSESASYTFTASGDRALVAAFEEEWTGKLPKGYTEVEYVLTDWTTVLRSGVTVGTNTTKVVMDITPQEKVAAHRYLFWAMSLLGGSSANSLMLRQNNAANQMWYITGYNSGTFGTFTYDMKSGTRIVVEMDTPNKKIKMGAKSFSISKIDSWTAGELYFGGNYSYVSSYVSLKMFIHSAQVYVGGELKGDFVPCINPEGSAGLYNLADSTFHTASSGTALTPGPAV